jgi:hypothetical protein
MSLGGEVVSVFDYHLVPTSTEERVSIKGDVHQMLPRV